MKKLLLLHRCVLFFYDSDEKHIILDVATSHMRENSPKISVLNVMNSKRLNFTLQDPYF